MSAALVGLLLIVGGTAAPLPATPPPLPASQPAASASELRSLLGQAELAQRRGDPAATLGHLERALRLARQGAPLDVSQLTVVDTAPEGLGMYRPVPGATVRGGTLLLYAEVRNFGSRATAEGEEVDLGIDAGFYYEDGEHIATTRGIGDHRFVARTHHDVTFVVVELNLQGMPAQPYLVELTLTDRVSGKQGSARTRFVVVG